MNAVYSLNPDTQFTKNKRKAIKQNNGFCPGCPKTSEFHCKCPKFVNQPYSGWCDVGLFYKEVFNDEGDVNV